ncbi:MAG TPA: GNAT family N-acetyltransferase [Gaiellales bacterium]|jgi:GNAT superfamily N-acetyltransferase
MGWSIRDAAVEDAMPVGEVHVASWRAAYGRLIPRAVLDALDPAERAARWPEVLTAVDVAVVAEADGGGVIGFATAGRSRDDDAGPRVAEVGAIYVDEAWWRQGVGRALLAACVERLAALGFEQATLWTLEANMDARAFYERLGWRADGARDEYPTGDETRPVVRYRGWVA